MDVKDFVPNVIQPGRYGIMLVEINTCPICNEYMVIPPKNEAPFPKWIMVNFEAQLKKAGWVKQSGVTVDDKAICEQCSKNGKADFLCALCEERKSTEKIQDRFGDPPEFLCTDCYNTVSAKVWEEEYENLYDKHRYDFE